MTAAAPFTVTGELPSGLTLIEASAGTGKTYTLAALATRYVAERAVTASELCVVSFTEAATSELRGRLRSRMAEAAVHLGGATHIGRDPLLAHLAETDDDEIARRRHNLQGAVTEFDAATVSTIHGLCSRVLSAAGLEADSTLVDDRTAIEEIVDDLFVARWSEPGARPPATPAAVVRAVELCLTLPTAELTTVDEADLSAKASAAAHQQARDGVAAAAVVEEVLEAVREQRRRARRRTFDSLLTDTHALLTGPDGASAVAALRRRFRVVLVDEFQDTDQVQWEIFRTAFLDGPDPITVVLVGDPKQAIYRFRSAEISAYLDALAHTRDTGGQVRSLATNHRSGASLLTALEHLFTGVEFGDAEVRFHPVSAADPSRAGGLEDGRPPLELRCLPDGLDGVGTARALVRPDLVAEVRRLLTDVRIPLTKELDHPGPSGPLDPEGNPGTRPVTPSDIAVLVRSNADAAAFAEALAAAGVPATSSSSDSVADSPAADQWRSLLLALERPSALAPARRAMLGWFVDGDAAAIDALDDETTGNLLAQLHDWSRRLTEGGLPGLLAAVRRAGLRQRVLAHRAGARDLTDLDHVAELLLLLTGGRPTSASALLAALDALRDPDAAGDTEALAPELLARRIDGDDDTVKVLTVHKAKGLEFPIVLCPTLWTKPGGARGIPHARIGTHREIDADGLTAGTSKAKPFPRISTVAKEEVAAESQRLLYVAFTRARHRLVVWWSDAAKTSNTASPLGVLLAHACHSAPPEVDPRVLGSRADGTIGVVEVTVGAPGPVGSAITAGPPVGGDAPPLAAAVAHRRLDRSWRIWSFTSVAGVTAHRPGRPDDGRTDAPVVGGTDERLAIDEANDVADPDGLNGGDPDAATVTPFAALPGGAAFGTLVHSVLEHVDFAAPDLDDQLVAVCTATLRHQPIAVDPLTLAASLAPALRAPLGGPLGAHRLVDLARTDRLDEVRFDLPLAGLDARRLGEVLATHLDPSDLLHRWAVDLAGLARPVSIEGMLTGSIDLVARTDGRYWLGDHKTNVLPSGTDRQGLAEVMAAHDYPLQATLYLVALHRYLRWRLRAYDPDQHLEGAAYLFLRGMDPGQRPDDARGVFWWRPPTTALVALDHLLATGEAA